MKILLAALCIAIAGWGAVGLLDVDELVQRGRRGSGVCRRPVGGFRRPGGSYRRRVG